MKFIFRILDQTTLLNTIKYNPLEGIVYPKNHDVLEDKENYISEDDKKHLLNALESNELQVIILMGLMCGVRLGEAMALQDNGDYINNKKPNRHLKAALKKASTTK